MIYTLQWAKEDDPELKFNTDIRADFPPPSRAEESLALLQELSDAFPQEPAEAVEFRIPELVERETANEVESSVEQNHSDALVDFDPFHPDGLPFAEKIEYLEIHRHEVVALRESIAHLDNILASLDSFDRISGFTASYLDEVPPTVHLREIAKRICWAAYLDASAGQADAAFRDVIRVRSIALKTIPDSRTLIETLTWISVTSIAQETAKDLIEHYEISQPTLAKSYHPSLDSAITLTELFERSMRPEIVYFHVQMQQSIPQQTILGVPLYLPNASANSYFDHCQTIADCIESNPESIPQLQAEFESNLKRISPRNVLGRTLLLVAASTPSSIHEMIIKHFEGVQTFGKLLERHIQISDSSPTT